MDTAVLGRFPYTFNIYIESTNLYPIPSFYIYYTTPEDKSQAFSCKLTGKFTGQEIPTISSVQAKKRGLVFVQWEILRSTQIKVRIFGTVIFTKNGGSFCAIRRNPFSGLGSFYCRLITGVKTIYIVYSIYSSG